MFRWFARLFGKGDIVSTHGGSCATPGSSQLPENPVIVGFLLLKGTPRAEDILAILEASGLCYGEDASTPQVTDDGDVLFPIVYSDGYAYTVSLVPSPIGQREAEKHVNRAFFPEGEEHLAGYDHHMLVSYYASLSEQPAPASSEEMAAAIDAHARVCAHLLALPQAVGFYSGRTGNTYSAKVFRQVALEKPYRPGVIAPVRIVEDGPVVSLYSTGLEDCGIPEIQVVGRADEVGDTNLVFNYLGNIINYQLAGNRIAAGETLGRTAHELFMTSWAPWVGDPAKTALQLDIHI